MENAAKALLIAGGVLIAILLLSLATYFYAQMGSNVRRIRSDLDSNMVSEFNQHFLNYDGRGYSNGEPLSAQEAGTLINLVKNHNDNPKLPTTITILLNGSAISDDYITWLNNARKATTISGFNSTTGDYNKEIKYKCKVNVNTNSLLVDKIELQSVEFN